LHTDGFGNRMRRRIIRALLGPSRFDRVKSFAAGARAHPRLALAFARASAMSALRQLDPTDPATWEFSGFSQNGEDGIIDYLSTHLLSRNRYFVEIGAGNGLENNTTWLALGRRYGGLMIDGEPSKIAECAEVFKRLNWALEFEAMLVNRHTIDQVERKILVRNPDLFSLDIDSIDFHVASELFERGLRPKIAVVEYNSVFGPDRSVTVPYQDAFNRRREHPTGYYYGASITAWRRLFDSYGYRFIAVEQNGLNAFFVNPAEFPAALLEEIRGDCYRENIVHRKESRTDWRGQFEQIRHLPLVEIEPARATREAVGSERTVNPPQAVTS
jgi:hypothetical protein